MSQSAPETTDAVAGPPGAAAPEIVPASETCWQRIGVYGDGSCKELQQHIHCRNCRVFSNEAHRLLDRPLPEDYRSEWTAHFAQEETPALPAKVSVVLFRIQAEWLALPTGAFQEVAERRTVHSLPHRRQGMVMGLVNVRGELLICVALARLLGLERAAPRNAARTAYDRLLVANWEGSRLVFPVDEVHGIHRFQAQELRSLPATVTRSQTSFSQGIFVWQQKAVGYLNPSPLFASINRSLA